MATDLLPGTDPRGPRGAGRPSAARPGSTVRVPELRHPARAPLLVGLIGFAIAVAGITVPSVWYDEAATITSATRSWAELGEMIRSVDAVHAAYYGLMHVVFDVVGYSPLALRMPSAIAVGVAAALVVVLVRQFGGTAHALLAGLVFCVIPRVTWMGTEGRSFAITTALGVAATLALVLAIRTGAKRWWVAYTALGILMCVVFVYTVLLIVAHAVSVLWWVLARERDRRALAHPVTRFLLAALITAAVIVPLGLAIEAQSGQVGWIDPLGPDTWRQVFRTQWFMYSYHFAIAAWILMAAGAVLLIRRAHGLSLAAVVIPAVVLPVAALIVATAVYSPLYSPRYVTLCTPYVAILMAAPIAYLRPRLLGLVAMAVVAALAIGPAVNERSPQAKQDSTWKEVAALIESQRAEDGPASSIAMIYGYVRRHPTATSRVIAYSYPDPFADTVDVTLTTPAGGTGHLWEEWAPLAESTSRLEGTDVAYLLTSIKRDLRPETTAIMQSEGWALSQEWNLGDVNVLRYERVG